MRGLRLRRFGLCTVSEELIVCGERETALPLVSVGTAGLAGEDFAPSSRDIAIALLRSSSSLSVDDPDMVTTLDVVVDVEMDDSLDIKNALIRVCHTWSRDLGYWHSSQSQISSLLAFHLPSFHVRTILSKAIPSATLDPIRWS